MDEKVWGEWLNESIIDATVFGGSKTYLTRREPRELTDEEIDELCQSIVEHGVDGPEKPRVLPLPGTIIVWYEEF